MQDMVSLFTLGAVNSEESRVRWSMVDRMLMHGYRVWTGEERIVSRSVPVDNWEKSERS
jgi:hypothetical protein